MKFKEKVNWIVSKKKFHSVEPKQAYGPIKKIKNGRTGQRFKWRIYFLLHFRTVIVPNSVFVPEGINRPNVRIRNTLGPEIPGSAFYWIVNRGVTPLRDSSI